MRFHESITAATLLHASFTAAQAVYADNQAPLEKDPEHIAQHFPDVDEIELLSPAFASPNTVPEGFSNGTAGPTDQTTMEYFLQTLSNRNDWMTYHTPSFQSEDGRSIPYVYLSTSQRPTGTPLDSYDNSTATPKLRVWMQGGVHGNEPGGDQALLALLGKLDANATWAEEVLDKVDIMMLPRYNPDGVAYFQRILATNLDPNRDHTKMARQQTRDIKQLVSSFAPHVGVDCHEFTASRAYGADEQWLHSDDGQFSAMKNLNIHRDIRRLSETLFADNIAAALESHDLRWHPYIVGDLGTDDIVFEETSSDAKVGDTFVGLGQAVMFLSETRGIRLGDQHFQRRTATGLVIVETLLQTAVDNADLVYDTVEKARADFIENDDEIVITDYPQATNISWSFIDTRNGSILEMPITFLNTTLLEPNVTRAKPEAYIFPKAWHDVAERLRIAGVEVAELQREFRGEVEALIIKGAELATSKYEGIARTTVAEVEVETKEIRIAPGGYWVSTRQKNAAHAFVTLEPEAIDSYATFNILPADVGYELPVYRVMK